MRINLATLLVASLWLTACGYHLRGAYDLPKGMKSVFLQGGSQTLNEQLLTVLKSSSGQLAASPDKADVIIRITRDTIERRVLSLSERGRSNEIELAGQLEYQIFDKNNKPLVEKTPVDFRREYFNDQQDVIAKDNEEIVIKNEMYQQVVKTIINRGRMALETAKK